MYLSNKGSSEPEMVAKGLLKDLEMDVPIDLFEVLNILGIEYREKPLDNGVDGMFVRVGEQAGIMVNSSIEYESRKRFTIAHEIGHCFIPSQQHINNFSCIGKNINSFDRVKEPTEYEADMFATEFLMPQHMFLKDVGKILPSIKSIKSLADKYRTSLTATALRFVDFTLEPCALVLMQDSSIRWTRKSRSFRFEFRQKPVDCFAYDLMKSGEEFVSDQLFSKLWLVNCNLEYIYEEAYSFKNLGQQLVIIKLYPDNYYSENNDSDDEDDLD